MAEAALTLLIPLGMAGNSVHFAHQHHPLSFCSVSCTSLIAKPSKRTPNEGVASYAVASENLGVWAGLLAASSLMVDYSSLGQVGISGRGRTKSPLFLLCNSIR